MWTCDATVPACAFKVHAAAAAPDETCFQRCTPLAAVTASHIAPLPPTILVPGATAVAEVLGLGRSFPIVGLGRKAS